MFSIKRIEGGTIITVLGLKIKLTRGLRLEQDNGGPYGMYDLIKMRAGVPFCVKSVVCQHGWNPLDHAGLSDLSVVKTLMLCWNARYQKACNESSNVPSAIVGAPFVHYRRMRNITLAPDARGTIAFPAHAIRVSRPQFDIEQYCQTLRALPEQYQPVTICLHPGDIIYHGLDAVYNKLGMKTVCAGLDDGEPFYSKFYRLLARHRYVTSNAPGSYSFYAIEMGIPFFILGEFPVEDNSGGVDTDMPKELLRVENHPALKKAYDLFTTERHDVITEEQRAFVLSELGMNDCLSPQELALALRKAAVDEHSPNRAGKRFTAFIKRLLRHPLCLGELVRFYRFLRESQAQLRQNAKG